MEYISDFDPLFRGDIEDGPSEEEIRNAKASGSIIRLRFTVTYLDANPDDTDFQRDYGWREAVVEEIKDEPEFGEGSITFIGIMLNCPVSKGAWYNGNFNNSYFKANYYPLDQEGSIEISIND